VRTKDEKNFENRVKQGLEIVKKEAIIRRAKNKGCSIINNNRRLKFRAIDRRLLFWLSIGG